MSNSLRLATIVLWASCMGVEPAKAGPIPFGTSAQGNGWNYTYQGYLSQYLDDESLSIHAGGSGSFPGAYFASSADLQGSKLSGVILIAVPFDGTVSSAVAAAGASLWDTFSFISPTPGEIGSLRVKGSYHSDNRLAAGNGSVGVSSAFGGQLPDGDFSIPGGTDGEIDVIIDLPLDSGPLYITESLALSSSASWGSQSDIIFDPQWTFILPPDVTMTSASGVAYNTESTIPEPSTSFLIALGLISVAGYRSKLLQRTSRGGE